MQRMRRASAFAIAVAALVLFVWGVPIDGQDLGSSVAMVQADLHDVPDPAAGVDEAAATIRELAYGVYAYLPRLILSLLVVAIGGAVARVGRLVVERALRGWERLSAVVAVLRLATALAVGVVALSILAGDSRAVVGSVGLAGLAASWALQTPIESFTGWLLNSFHGYYRVGDRIAVGEVFGDVYRIDVLTTTVWEAGGPGKAVTAAQPTGALITFPNWEVLRSNVVNYSRDFPYVWDEITVNVTNESDLSYTVRVIEGVVRREIGEDMADAANRYLQLLRARELPFEVETGPRVYVSSGASWTDCSIRYLVPVRARRAWASRLLVAVNAELDKPEHRGRITNAYPRSEIRSRDTWREVPPVAGPPDA